MNNITSRMLHIKDDNDLRTILRNVFWMLSSSPTWKIPRSPKSKIE